MENTASCFLSGFGARSGVGFTIAAVDDHNVLRFVPVFDDATFSIPPAKPIVVQSIAVSLFAGRRSILVLENGTGAVYECGLDEPSLWKLTVDFSVADTSAMPVQVGVRIVPGGVTGVAEARQTYATCTDGSVSYINNEGDAVKNTFLKTDTGTEIVLSYLGMTTGSCWALDVGGVVYRARADLASLDMFNFVAVRSPNEYPIQLFAVGGTWAFALTSDGHLWFTADTVSGDIGWRCMSLDTSNLTVT